MRSSSQRLSVTVQYYLIMSFLYQTYCGMAHVGCPSVCLSICPLAISCATILLTLGIALESLGQFSSSKIPKKSKIITFSYLSQLGWFQYISIVIVKNVQLMYCFKHENWRKRPERVFAVETNESNIMRNCFIFQITT